MTDTDTCVIYNDTDVIFVEISNWILEKKRNRSFIQNINTDYGFRSSSHHYLRDLYSK